MSVIAFIGSVFSPYYAWSGRRDPENHVCMNVALYAPGRSRWAMTERGRTALHRTATTLRLGPSAMRWDGASLNIAFDEVSVPRPPAQWRPRRIAGRIRLRPTAPNARVFGIDAAGAHAWRPIAPDAEVEVDLTGPEAASWRGRGYIDSNWGREGLEDGFVRWDWSRSHLPNGGAEILYDTARRDGSRGLLGLRFTKGGDVETFDPPAPRALKAGFWGVERAIACDPGYEPRIVRTLEDGPFYLRALVSTRIGGAERVAMHESVSGARFGSRIVKLMLPFRMPRRTRPA